MLRDTADAPSIEIVSESLQMAKSF